LRACQEYWDCVSDFQTVFKRDTGRSFGASAGPFRGRGGES
jgi:hypothetical protein